MDRFAQLGANGRNTAGLVAIGTFPLGVGDAWSASDDEILLDEHPIVIHAVVPLPSSEAWSCQSQVVRRVALVVLLQNNIQGRSVDSAPHNR